MNESVSFAVVASALGAVILLGGGGWAGWMSMKVIDLGKDMAVVKSRLKINGGR